MNLDAEQAKTAEEQGDEGYHELYKGMRRDSFCLQHKAHNLRDFHKFVKIPSLILLKFIRLFLTHHYFKKFVLYAFCAKCNNPILVKFFLFCFGRSYKYNAEEQ